MITRGEDVEASALRQRGWSVTAIARHLERDRKTVRAYLRGDRESFRRVACSRTRCHHAGHISPNQGSKSQLHGLVLAQIWMRATREFAPWG
jgi:IS30 family transposase